VETFAFKLRRVVSAGEKEVSTWGQFFSSGDALSLRSSSNKQLPQNYPNKIKRCNSLKGAIISICSDHAVDVMSSDQKNKFESELW